MVNPTADAYSAPSGGGVFAGFPPMPLSSLRVALFGDSNTTHLQDYNLSPWFWINALAAQGAFEVVANAGVAGDTVGDMLARVHNLYTAGSPGLAGLSPLGAVAVCPGTNNARAGNSWASIAATVVALLSAIKSYCDHVYILAVPPIGSSESSYVSKNALTLDYNAGLAAIAAANPASYTFVALDADIRNGDGSQLAGTFNIDGVHPIGTGVYLQGNKGAQLLAPVWSGWGLVSPLSSDPADVYPAQPQWLVNPMMAGTGGSVGDGWAGQMSNNWAISSNGSGIAGTVEKVASVDAIPVPWQRVRPTQVSRTGNGESVRLATALAGPSITTGYPTALDMMVQLRFNAFNTNYINLARAWVQGASGSRISVDMDLRMGGAVITHDSVVLRLKMPRPSTVAETGATLYWDWFISQNFSGDMGSFDFRRFTIRE